MKVKIRDFEKIYSFEMLPITQLCGQNIQKKSYIFESLRRYFSSYKYSEAKNKWRDNVFIDNESVGRKYFSVLSIKNEIDILQMIKWSKQGLLMNYVENLMQKFDWQLHLQTLFEEVEEMFQLINEDVGKLGDIELTFSMAKVWDMVQKSEISCKNDIEISDKNNYELICIFLKLLDAMLSYIPQKTMVIFENIDHMVDRKAYVDILNDADELARKYDLYFLFSSSIDGYVYCNEELCSGISVFGNVEFQMPQLENVCEFVRENYPYAKNFSEVEIQKIMSKIIQKIGQEEYLYSIEESVVCKMINESLLLYDKFSEEKLPEMAFLKA